MKTLVDVGVPAISEHYYVRIPTFLTVREVTELIAKAVEELSNQTYKSSGTEFLCFAETFLFAIRADAGAFPACICGFKHNSENAPTKRVRFLHIFAQHVQKHRILSLTLLPTQLYNNKV